MKSKKQKKKQIIANHDDDIKKHVKDTIIKNDKMTMTTTHAITKIKPQTKIIFNKAGSKFKQ